jgi:hypothetical protein
MGLLCKNNVDFILIGGVAAIVQGAPIMTFDLDLVHERSPQNIEALLYVLRQIDAHYRGRSQRNGSDSLKSL